MWLFFFAPLSLALSTGGGVPGDGGERWGDGVVGGVSGGEGAGHKVGEEEEKNKRNPQKCWIPIIVTTWVCIRHAVAWGEACVSWESGSNGRRLISSD